MPKVADVLTDPAVPDAPLRRPGWRIHGRARIDYRPAVPCVLVVNADGTWAAEIATFTLADRADLFFVADEGHLCGPVFVGYSRADSAPFKMRTELIGNGPLLVVDPKAEAPDAEMVDAEVIGDP